MTRNMLLRCQLEKQVLSLNIAVLFVVPKSLKEYTYNATFVTGYFTLTAPEYLHLYSKVFCRLLNQLPFFP